MLSTTSYVAVVTGLDGFDVLNDVARLADTGRSLKVELTSATFVITGHTIGLIAYCQMCGFDTDELRRDLDKNGPRRDPQHLHLVNAELATPDGARTLPVTRIRLREIRTAKIHHDQPTLQRV